MAPWKRAARKPADKRPLGTPRRSGMWIKDESPVGQPPPVREPPVPPGRPPWESGPSLRPDAGQPSPARAARTSSPSHPSQAEVDDARPTVPEGVDEVTLALRDEERERARCFSKFVIALAAVALGLHFMNAWNSPL